MTQQAPWSLKMRALTEQCYVDEVEGEEETLADVLMDDNSIATVARPGTSLRTAATATSGPSQGVRWGIIFICKILWIETDF